MAALAAAAAWGLVAVPPGGAVGAAGAPPVAPAVRTAGTAAEQPARNRVVDTVLRGERYDYQRKNWRVQDADRLPRWLRLRGGRLTGTAPRLGTWRIGLVERGVRTQRGETRRTTLVLKAVTPRAAPGTVLVTRGLDGRPANGWSGDVTVSGDGGTVVFSSAATNLVAGTRRGVERLYVWEASSRRVSLLHPDAWTRVEGLSHDGRRVLLDLDPGLVLLDRTDGSLTEVAPRASGAALTADGARVVYRDRYPVMNAPAPQLLEWTAATGTTRTVVPDLGSQVFAGMSDDARHVVLVDADRSRMLDTTDGSVRDLGRLGVESGSTRRVAVSNDGRLVSVTGAGIPACCGDGGRPVGGVHDTLLGSSLGPSRDNLGAAVTADGAHYTVATSRRPLRLVATATAERSAAFVGRPAGTQESVSLSDDASRVAYASDAHDVLRGTRRGVANVFIWVRGR
ncbi:hypothetical protein [Nocardioides sp. zg-1228]|uniref:hypothetical protein n=1 Tax=Nocardioides sp. zg-1228 TaxID=2763008 RepID=UPI001642DEB9|nr:hypothetical protein [Nocardioides sp. zg-1228]MBC2933115.1 hypothetical protein [Nocardioides sp. zg-1228]QSF56699.1 hypothetical protein JX575_13920 [Nocardioides sp. zg-1228]